MYDPAYGRFTAVDPLAERRISTTPFNYVQNNPVLRIDPNGLTDFTFNKRTGEFNQVGESNSEPDRVVRTDKNGNVKKKGDGLFGFLVKEENRGDAKVLFNGIEKGILRDGINFKEENQIIGVGNDDQPSVEGVKDFIFKLSNYVGREIGGSFFSKETGENTSHITVGRYKNNTDKSIATSGDYEAKKMGLVQTTFFHTHLRKFSDVARLKPSRGDLSTREDDRNNIKFIILTSPRKNGPGVLEISY